MVLLVRHPNTPPKDRDLGPGAGRVHRNWFARLTLEEQLALAWKPRRSR